MGNPDYCVSFKQKQIDAIQTVAELLCFSRNQYDKTIADAAEVLQISPIYIEALENGDYSKLPSYVYTRNFVKRYGAWLDLNLTPLLELFEQEWNLFEKLQQSLPQLPSKLKVNKRDFWTMPRWIRTVGASLVIISIVGYLGYELYDLRQPPILTIETPQEEMISEKQIVEIRGLTEPEASLSINDQTVLSDADGNFTENMALQPGLNIIEISAKRKYSKTATVFRKIIVQDATTFSQNMDRSEG